LKGLQSNNLMSLSLAVARGFLEDQMPRLRITHMVLHVLKEVEIAPGINTGSITA